MKKCFLCGEPGSEFFGSVICDSCKSNLGLFTDETIARQNKEYKKNEKDKNYEAEIRYRLDFIEKDYLKKRLKLLHILDRLENS